jgi:hypothetical protein
MLKPLRCLNAGVSKRRRDDELVMRKDGMLPVFFVPKRTINAELAPIWWRKIDRLCKVEL